MLETELIVVPEVKETENRGRPIKCKYCNKEFKIINIEEKKEWREHNYHCPLCNEEFCILPPTERLLRNLQTRYLATRSDKILGEMFVIIKSYAQSLLKQRYSGILLKRHDGADYYSHEVATIMIEKYLDNPGFKVESSFGGYMKGRGGHGGPLAQGLAYKFDYVKEESSLDFVYEDGSSVENSIGDDKKTVLQLIEEKEDIKLLHKRMIKLIQAVEPYCKTKEENFIRIHSIYLYLNGGEKAFDRYFNAFGREGKWMAMKTLDIIKSELLKDTQDTL